MSDRDHFVRRVARNPVTVLMTPSTSCSGVTFQSGARVVGCSIIIFDVLISEKIENLIHISSLFYDAETEQPVQKALSDSLTFSR